MKRLLFAIASFFLCSPLFAQKPLTLAAAAEKAAKDLPRGCIVTGEWRDGKAVYAIAGPDKPAGVAAEKVVFEIGSISKTFTGILLAQAVLEKKLTFETTLKQALDSKQTFIDEKVAAITLAQLTTHTSGLPRMPDNADFTGTDPYVSYDTKKLREWLATVKLEKAGPHELSYSNVGIAVLGHVIERALGDSWENLVRDRICQPLGMHDTTPKPNAEQQKRLAPPFDSKAVAHAWNFQAFAPAGALRSTAADMMLYARALAAPDKSPLKEAIALATKPLAEGIGCCFFLDGATISHGGGTGGYRTHFEASPKNGLARLILINNTAVDDSSVMREITRQNFVAVAGSKLTESELAPYLGVFDLGKEAKFTFILRDGGLWGKLTGQPFLPFTHETADSFFHRGVAARLIFKRDEAKGVTAVVLDQNGFKQTAQRSSSESPTYLFRPAKELEEYTGTYDLLPPFKVFTIELRRGTLFVQLTGQPFMPVFETKKDHFEYDVVPAAIEFERDATTGAILRLHLHQNGLKLPALRQKKAP